MSKSNDLEIANDGEITSGEKAQVYRSLDMWRGIAYLWVVMYHGTTATVQAYPQLRSFLLYVLSQHGAYGVWMFFVISGYCIAGACCQSLVKGRGLVEYLRARIRRIYPPFFFSVVFYASICLLAEQLVKHKHLKSGELSSQNILHQSFLYYFSNLTLTQKIFHQNVLQGVYWTLNYEILFYAVVGLCLWIAAKRGGVPLALLLMHSLTLVTALALLCFPRHQFLPFDLWPHFGLGVLVYDLHRRPLHLPTKLFFGATAATFALFFALGLAPQGPDDHVGIGAGPAFVFSVSFAVLLVLLHRFDARLVTWAPVKLLSWVGVISYSLYLTHYALVALVTKIATMKGLIVPYFVLTRFVALFAAVGFSWVFFTLCERPFLSRKRQVINAISEGQQ